MATVRVGNRSLIDAEVLEAVKRLPDDFLVLAEFDAGRNVDWLIVRLLPDGRTVLNLTELKRRQLPLSGLENSSWTGQTTAGEWRPIPCRDGNYFHQAINTARSFGDWLYNNRRGYVADEARADALSREQLRVRPHLLILPAGVRDGLQEWGGPALHQAQVSRLLQKELLPAGSLRPATVFLDAERGPTAVRPTCALNRDHPDVIAALAGEPAEETADPARSDVESSDRAAGPVEAEDRTTAPITADPVPERDPFAELPAALLAAPLVAGCRFLPAVQVELEQRIGRPPRDAGLGRVRDFLAAAADRGLVRLAETPGGLVVALTLDDPDPAASGPADPAAKRAIRDYWSAIALRLIEAGERCAGGPLTLPALGALIRDGFAELGGPPTSERDRRRWLGQLEAAGCLRLLHARRVHPTTGRVRVHAGYGIQRGHLTVGQALIAGPLDVPAGVELTRLAEIGGIEAAGTAFAGTSDADLAALPADPDPDGDAGPARAGAGIASEVGLAARLVVSRQIGDAGVRRVLAEIANVAGEEPRPVADLIAAVRAALNGSATTLSDRRLEHLIRHEFVAGGHLIAEWPGPDEPPGQILYRVNGGALPAGPGAAEAS